MASFKTGDIVRIPKGTAVARPWEGTKLGQTKRERFGIVAYTFSKSEGPINFDYDALQLLDATQPRNEWFDLSKAEKIGEIKAGSSDWSILKDSQKAAGWNAYSRKDAARYLRRTIKDSVKSWKSSSI